MTQDCSEYPYANADAGWEHGYLLPPIIELIDRAANGKATRIFEIGTGNGAIANALATRGHEVTGIDYSASGVGNANRAFPALRIEQGSAYDDLKTRFGEFPIVLSIEVIEHLYFPRMFAQRAFEVLEPNGTLVLSTPFHGYWKNLALAMSGKLDAHFTALWDGGHIKFWSTRTLRVLLTEAGFVDVDFTFAGRMKPFSKSMIAIARRP
jgi:2-polyprenyl-3-methyl-5-hydroxy-6-metoxy-1,4-benzoquinol methylase